MLSCPSDERLRASSAKLDNQVQTALKASSGTYVILDLHNYARFESKQVGTEVPAADFANLWSQLAKKYAGEARIIFGLMNEPRTSFTSRFCISKVADSPFIAVVQTT